MSYLIYSTTLLDGSDLYILEYELDGVKNMYESSSMDDIRQFIKLNRL